MKFLTSESFSAATLITVPTGSIRFTKTTTVHTLSITFIAVELLSVPTAFITEKISTISMIQSDSCNCFTSEFFTDSQT